MKFESSILTYAHKKPESRGEDARKGPRPWRLPFLEKRNAQIPKLTSNRALINLNG